MYEEIKSGAGCAGDGTGENRAVFYNVEVKCPRPIYRRAGFAFVRGKNTLENVSPEQLAILRTDSVLHLALVSEAPVSPDALPGGMDVLDVGGLNSVHLNTVQDELRAVITPAVTVDVPEAPSLSVRIRRAVASLDKANADHFTQNGSPRVAAVSGVLGENISAAQLKAALEEDAAE
ncbi:HI1506-related protein [Citrobacter koseri]|uniref:HI1506-related protein n=1 Tax=Citrobacter koseri TaxID=545 RepID=UPI002E3713D6|nr:HI1506-related protein [Citrobacter koseri]